MTDLKWQRTPLRKLVRSINTRASLGLLSGVAIESLMRSPLARASAAIAPATQPEVEPDFPESAPHAER